MEAGLPGNNRCVFLIQARLFSSRLPGKILFNFFGDKIIERIIKIKKKITNRKNIFIVTGNKKKNKILENIAKKNQIKIFFGDEERVLFRFRNLLKSKSMEKYDYVYRLTADNYLIQPKIIKIMLTDTFKNEIDYGYVMPLSHYAGEIISKKLFFKNYKFSKKALEHVTWDFRKNKNIKISKYPKNFLGLNHTESICLDTIEDLIKLKNIEIDYPKLKNIDNYNYLKKIENELLYNR